jgi:hypothetical protein
MRRLTTGPAFRAGAMAAPPPAADAEAANADVEERIAAWLARLRLLHGVPIHYLVPNARMLPVESIRFFRLDARWVEVLVDGAFSLGRPVTGTDHHEATRLARVNAKARRLAPQLRAARLGLATVRTDDGVDGTEAETDEASGFLLRSAVVGGWPNLEVEALDADDVEIPPLRLERLSADVMLGIYPRPVRRVRFREPAETLHFGVKQEHGAPPEKALKYVDTGPGGELPGTIVEGAPLVPVPMRDAGRADGVVDVDLLAAKLLDALKAASAISSTPWTPAAFALEMIQGVQEVDYVVEGLP